LPGTNALAYYEKSQIMAVKSSIVQAPELPGVSNQSCMYCEPFLLLSTIFATIFLF
jgi:hypothetical protein